MLKSLAPKDITVTVFSYSSRMQGSGGRSAGVLTLVMEIMFTSNL